MRSVWSSGRIVVGTAATMILLSATVLGAAEYFVPKGHLYGPESSRLPPAHSHQAYIERQTDVLETELHRREREDRLFYDRFKDFIDRDVTTPGYDGGGHYSYY